MQSFLILFTMVLFGCSSGGEHIDVQTPGGADTLQLGADSIAGIRIDGTSVNATNTDTLAP